MQRTRTFATIVVAVAALLWGACGGGGGGGGGDDDAKAGAGGDTGAQGTTTTAATDEARSGADAVLTIKDFSFSGVSTVPKGTTVTVKNDDSTRHTVHPDKAGAFTPVELDAGKSGDIAFATAGTFAYHCNIHPSMKGTLTVT